MNDIDPLSVIWDGRTFWLGVACLEQDPLGGTPVSYYAMFEDREDAINDDPYLDDGPVPWGVLNYPRGRALGLVMRHHVPQGYITLPKELHRQ